MFRDGTLGHAQARHYIWNWDLTTSSAIDIIQYRVTDENRTNMTTEHEQELLESSLDIQEGGDHYKSMKIQPVEFTTANNLTFLEGCVIKRVCRHRSKNGAEDIRKAIHELNLILELEYCTDSSKGV